ncbi:MAG: cobalamin-dependent protein [Alphaproteobacteria bacterium]|nr:cobalamin-dependent protein [Alphaproteobacteria bacterium]
MTLDLAAPAEARKAEIARAIKPDPTLTELPALLGPRRRVLLVVPPGTLEESYGKLSAAAGELPMLGLAFIAGSLRDQGHEVRVIDYEVNGWPMARVEDDLRTFKPDVVGMTAYITNMRRCAKVAELAKRLDPAVTVVLGGPQVTIFPEEAFACPDIDMIVLSEGEIIVRNVMNALGDPTALRQVKGIWFRDGGEVVRNPREGLVDDLDILPRPALDLYDMDLYFPPAHIQGSRVVHLLTSRGCPFKCTFCETKLTFGRSFRYHSTDRVLEEMAGLVARGYDSFQFYDDIFTVNRKRVTELCQGIIDRGWKIRWMCFTRTNCLDEDVLAIMKKAGCYLITFGCETGNDDLLQLLKKGLTVEQNRRGIAMAKKAGIKACSSFMLGLPGETREHTERTIAFALESGLDYAVFPITEPYPGTEMWIDAAQYGTFDDSGRYANSLLTENAAVWVPHGRTREELSQMAQDAMRQFYLRPRIVLQSLMNFTRMPPSRAVRFLWAGIRFFIIDRRRRSTAGTRY